MDKVKLNPGQLGLIHINDAPPVKSLMHEVRNHRLKNFSMQVMKAPEGLIEVQAFVEFYETMILHNETTLNRWLLAAYLERRFFDDASWETRYNNVWKDLLGTLIPHIYANKHSLVGMLKRDDKAKYSEITVDKVEELFKLVSDLCYEMGKCDTCEKKDTCTLLRKRIEAKKGGVR